MSKKITAVNLEYCHSCDETQNRWEKRVKKEKSLKEIR